MPSNYKGTRDVKKEHYNMGILLTEEKKVEILKTYFFKRVGYKLNIENPKTFNEKIMWYKLYYQDPLITKCSDKFAVKDYVTNTLGDGYVIPTIASWDNPDDIDFDTLPNQFVLKVNWSSGYNIICKDKSQLDIEATKKKLKRWMQPDRNSYYQFFNWGYKHMKPVVYAEQYIEQVDGQVYDYKFFVFNGKVKVLFIATDRNGKDTLTFNYFDRDFNFLPLTYGKQKNADPLPEKPKNYDKMIEYAEKLAKPFPFVRVDFYETGDQVYLGEMTFYSGGGLLAFDPVEWDYKLGELFELPPKLITDKEGVLYPVKLGWAKFKKKHKNDLKNIRRKIIRHDLIKTKHYLTLLNFIRMEVTNHSEKGRKFFHIKNIDIFYAKGSIPKKKSDPSFAIPSFAPLSPMYSFMMEDKITYDMKKHYCEQKAYKQLGYFPNLDNPKSFNEKLLWLALNYKNPQHAIASDKALAKKWISDRIGDGYVVPLIGAYSNINDINFDELPDKFVMKANEGWGADSVLLIRGKARYNPDRLKAIASTWLYPWSSYYYNNMCITDEKPEQPLVVIEELLEQDKKKHLDDYKLYCCNGQVKFALIVTNRGSIRESRTYVDRDWNVLPVRRKGKYSSTAPAQPDNFQTMIELAEKLSSGFPIVRVDFYNVNGHIYVGEMTFTPGLFLCFQPKEWDFKLGEYLDISELLTKSQVNEL